VTHRTSEARPIAIGDKLIKPKDTVAVGAENGKWGTTWFIVSELPKWEPGLREWGCHGIRCGYLYRPDGSPVAEVCMPGPEAFPTENMTEKGRDFVRRLEGQRSETPVFTHRPGCPLDQRWCRCADDPQNPRPNEAEALVEDEEVFARGTVVTVDVDRVLLDFGPDPSEQAWVPSDRIQTHGRESPEPDYDTAKKIRNQRKEIARLSRECERHRKRRSDLWEAIIDIRGLLNEDDSFDAILTRVNAVLAGRPGEPSDCAGTPDLKELARKAVASCEARKDEDVDAWAEKLAADSVAAGEAEYGATPSSSTATDEKLVRIWLEASEYGNTSVGDEDFEANYEADRERLLFMLAEVRAEEREACAKVAEGYSQAEGQLDDGAAIARDIRARSTHPRTR
jgi:hypothetical protein